MAMTTTLPITQTLQNPAVAIVNSTSFIAANGGTAPTNTVLFATAGANGSIIKSIMVASDDSSARSVSFYLSKDSGTTNYLLGTVSIPAGSGLTTGTTVNVDALASAVLIGFPVDRGGRPILELVAAARIYVGIITAAVTSGRTVHVVGQQEDY